MSDFLVFFHVMDFSMAYIGDLKLICMDSGGLAQPDSGYRPSLSRRFKQECRREVYLSDLQKD